MIFIDAVAGLPVPRKDVCSKKALHDWGTSKQGQCRHAGTDVTTNTDQNQTSITVDQTYCIDMNPDIEIEPARLRQQKATLTTGKMPHVEQPLGIFNGWLSRRSLNLLLGATC